MPDQKISHTWQLIHHALSLVGLVTLCLLFCFFLYIRPSSHNIPELFLGFGIAIGVFWLSVLFHELGHAVVALLCGFRLQKFMVFPWELSLKDGRWRLAWLNQSNYLGLVDGSLPSMNGYRWRYILMIAAGPLVNLLLVICCYLGIRYLHNHVESLDIVQGIRMKPPHAYFYLLAAALGLLMNMHLFLYTIIPGVFANYILNDGAKIYLFFTKPESQRFIIICQLAEQMGRGTRPREWNVTELFTCLGSAPMQDYGDAFAHLLGYYHFLDRGGYTTAEVMLQHALELEQQVNDIKRPSITLEHIYFQAMHRNNLVEDWGKINELKNLEPEVEPSRLRAHAAVLFLQGELLEARDVCQRAIKVLESSNDRGGALAETDWLQAMIDRCNDSFRIEP